LVVDERATVGWGDVFAVVRSSAERRLGRPLLVAYLVLAIFGIAVVVACVVVMHF
jgi:hypothetical protein